MGKIKLGEFLKILQKFSMDEDRNAKKSQTLIYTDVANVLKQGITPELFIAIPHTTTINRIFTDSKPTPDDIKNALNTNESYKEKIKRLKNNFNNLNNYNFENVVAEFIASKDQPKNMDKYKFLAQILIKSILEKEFDVKVIASESIVKKQDTSPKQDSRNQNIKRRKKIICIVLVSIFLTYFFYVALEAEDAKRYFSQLNPVKIKSAYYVNRDTININGVELNYVAPTIPLGSKFKKMEYAENKLYVCEQIGFLEGYSLVVNRNTPQKAVLSHFKSDSIRVNDLYNQNSFLEKSSTQKAITINFQINDEIAYITLNDEIYFQNSRYRPSSSFEFQDILDINIDSNIYLTDDNKTLETKVLSLANDKKGVFYYLLSKENSVYRIVEKKSLKVELF